MEIDHSTDTITPDAITDPLVIGGTAGLVIPAGTTVERPATTAGLLRWNTDLLRLEMPVGSSWQVIEQATNALSATWKFSTSITASDPSSKYFKFNSATLSSVTNIYISETSSDNIDTATVLSFLTTGNRIYVQQKDTATNAVVFSISGPVIDNGTWRTIPVTVLNSNTLMQNNSECIFAITFSGAGGGGGSGTVTSVSVSSANGISGTVVNATTTPDITLTLANITPSTVTLGSGTNSISTATGIPLALTTGNALNPSSNGNDITITAGIGGSSSGNGGNLTFNAGSPINGAGGNLAFNGGNGAGTNQNAGTISFNGGSPSGTGGSGDIIFGTRGITRLRIGGLGDWNINANNDSGVKGAAITSYGSGVPVLWKRQMPHYDANIDFGFVGDLKQPFILGVGYDGAMTSGSNVLTCTTTAPFILTDVGKRITVAGAGPSGSILVAYISSYTSPTTVTLSVNASTTVTGKCVRYGTDNTNAIMEMETAINNSAYNYVTIFFPQSETNAYGFPRAVTLNKQTIIKGIGSSSTTDCGDYTKSGGTCLSWWGSGHTTGTTTFGGFWNIEPTTGINNTPIVGDAFQDCWVDCRNGDQAQALKGIVMNSNAAFTWNNVFVMDALAVAIDMGVVAPGVTTPNANSLGMAKDCTRGSINNLRVRMLDNTSSPNVPTLTPTTTTTATTLSTTPQSLTLAANNGLTSSGYIWMQTSTGYPVLVNYTGGGGTTTLTGCTVSALEAINTPTTVNGSYVVQCTPANGCAVRLSGDVGANTCCNDFNMWQISHGTSWGPAAILLQNSDSNQFSQVIINGGNATFENNINRYRKPGVFFAGSSTSNTLASRNNVFIGGSAGAGGATANGVNNALSILTGPASANYWYEYQLGNGEPIPRREKITATTTQGDIGPLLDYTLNGGLVLGARGAPKVTTQAPAASTLTHIQGSLVAIPPQGLQIGTTIRWRLIISKTAAGAVTNSFNIRLGTTGSTSDTAINTFTTSTGTAAADTAEVLIEFLVRTTGSSATGWGCMTLMHNLTSTGWINVANNVIQSNASTFNSVNQGQYLSLTCTMGTGMVATIHSCVAEVINGG